MKVPGDKSLTQRALIFAALSEGESRVSGLLPGADPRSTAGALRALGAQIPPLPPDGREIRIRGRGLEGLLAPSDPLDLGNSGTGARLLLGVLAGRPFEAVATGDASLRARPMTRVTDPLSSMGAKFEFLASPGRLPVRVRGGELRPLEYDLPVASAQVKSALLLAGLTGKVSVLLTEPGRSRDHTERMLRMVGVPVVNRPLEVGRRVELRAPPDRIEPLDFRVPGDFSSAAFFLALGALGVAGEHLTLEEVGLNPTRTGFLRVLARMGVRLEIESPSGASRSPPGSVPGEGVEPTGTLRVHRSRLAATEVGGDEVVLLIDEVPLVAILAVRAEGETRITGAGELRVKETDRIRALVENLRALGVEAEELEDGLVVRGREGPLRGDVRAHGDHRIAMAFGVLGAEAGNEIRVDEPGVVEVSFPGFWDELRALTEGAEARSGRTEGASARSGSVPGRGVAGGRSPRSGDRRGREEEGRGRRARRRAPVVTIDGPAGSGKSTTARAVARELGFRHLDSGALYRAVTWALFESGISPEGWEDLTAEEVAALEIGLQPEDGVFEVLHRGRRLGDELRSETVTEAVSRVATLPAVRAGLLELQREAAHGGGLVADGRDMGTVVFPEAEAKFFLVADLEERARRRLRDQGRTDPDPERIRDEMAKIRRRDRRDRERRHSPLRCPEDAYEIDTTGIPFGEQVRTIVDRVRALTDP